MHSQALLLMAMGTHAALSPEASNDAVDIAWRLIRWQPGESVVYERYGKARNRAKATTAHVNAADAKKCPCFTCRLRSGCKIPCQLFLRYCGDSPRGPVKSHGPSYRDVLIEAGKLAETG